MSIAFRGLISTRIVSAPWRLHSEAVVVAGDTRQPTRGGGVFMMLPYVQERVEQTVYLSTVDIYLNAVDEMIQCCSEKTEGSATRYTTDCIGKTK